MDQYLENKTLLRSLGIRATEHRLRILALLEEAEAGRTAEQLFTEIQDKDRRISLSTVYRIMEIFEERKLVLREVSQEDGRSFYELNRHQHRHYLICTGCRRRVPISSCPLHRMEKELADETGFRIAHHRLELYGVCPECMIHKTTR